MLSLAIGLVAVAVQAPSVAEPSALPEPFQITAPPWRNRATGEDVARVYPPRAREQRVDARVTMECRVVADGRMSACVVLDEEPAGYGFWGAALKLAPKFRLHSTLPDGTRVEGGMIKIPLRFMGPWSSAARGTN